MEYKPRKWKKSAKKTANESFLKTLGVWLLSGVLAPVGSVVGSTMGFAEGLKNKENPITKAAEYGANGFYGGVEEAAVMGSFEFRNPLELGLNYEDEDEEWKEAPIKVGIGRPRVASIHNCGIVKGFANAQISGWEDIEKLEKKVLSVTTPLVLEEGFEELFTKTYFMQLYMKTPRISELSEVVEDLCKVLPSKTHSSIKKFAEKYKDDNMKAIMHIWTQFSAVTQPINFALMLDGYETFHCDYNDKEFIEKKLKEDYKHDYKTIIKHSIKFIRMVNYYIVRVATKKNIEDRITYRGIQSEVFRTMKVGQKFRVMNFQCTSADIKIAEGFANKRKLSEKDYSMITFKIPKGCFNAGIVGKNGLKKYWHQKETLIPPYTLCKLVSKEGNKMTVEVAYDNKSEKFSYFSF